MTATELAKIAEAAEAAVVASIAPLGDRLLVRPLEEPERTKGGLYIPAGSQERSQRGEVIAAGPGRVTDYGVELTMTVAVGDVILFGKYTGSEIVVGEETLLIIRETDVMAVFKAGSF